MLLFDKLKSESKGTFTGEEVWAKLNSYYDLEKLDALENGEDTPNQEGAAGKVSAPLNRICKQQQEFHLPWDEYGDLILENARGAEEDQDEQDEREEADESAGELDAEQTGGEQTAAKEEVPVEEVPRRVTRSVASGMPTGRVTRSRGPAELEGGIDGHDELAAPQHVNAETRESKSPQQEQEEHAQAQEEQKAEPEEKEEGDESAGNSEEVDESENRAVNEEEEQEGANKNKITEEEVEQPPSKRTRTTRSSAQEPVVQVSSPAPITEDALSAPAENEELAQPASIPKPVATRRSSMRNSSRRKARR